MRDEVLPVEQVYYRQASGAAKYDTPEVCRG